MLASPLLGDSLCHPHFVRTGVGRLFSGEVTMVEEIVSQRWGEVAWGGVGGVLFIILLNFWRRGWWTGSSAKLCERGNNVAPALWLGASR